MKKIILLLILTIFVTSCFSNKGDIIKNNVNQEKLNNGSGEELISSSQNNIKQGKKDISGESVNISERF